MDAQPSMNSWLGSQNCGDGQHPGWSSTTTSPRIGPHSPGRREHAMQPPLLTTGLSSSQYQGPGGGLGLTSTPGSSTSSSLSSPFVRGSSPCVSSPATSRPAPSSSMASRNAYNVPYNPQDWGPPGRSETQGYAQPGGAHRAPQRKNPDESLSQPPPPYSPPTNQNRLSQEFTGHSNRSFAVTPSPGHRDSECEILVQYQRRSTRPRPLSMVYSSDPPAQQHSLPPPPPPQGHANRSVSQSHVDYQGMPYAGQNSSYDASNDYGLRSFQPQPSSEISAPPIQLDQFGTRPPASRRAASAGAVVNSAASSRTAIQSHDRSPSKSNWKPGMPLPPPPPRPQSVRPPSVSGSSESSMKILPVPANKQPSLLSRRAAPALGTGLGSIPPTPADWIDEGFLNNRPSEVLHIDTGKAAQQPESEDPHDPSSQRTPGSGGLFRNPAIRDIGGKGIRERRNERRNRQSQTFEPQSATTLSCNPWADALEQIKPSDLVLPGRPIDSDQINRLDQSRNSTPAKYATPRSTRSTQSEGHFDPLRSRASSGGLFSGQSPRGTPQYQSSSASSSAAFAHTPPFSPDGHSKQTSPAVPPKRIPTPPPNSSTDARLCPRAPSQGAEDRSISQNLHMPSDTMSGVRQLSPQVSMESVHSKDSAFTQDALLRHKNFIEKEAHAVDEAEALKVFADYILAESQIRRQRYSKAWESFRVDDVRRNLFELPVTKPSPNPPKLSIPQNRANRPESAWWNNYQPILSPIASIGMSNDEMSSRGRAPSRWWESKTGSSGEGAEKVQRSKRESKYMGLHPLDLEPQNVVNMDFGPNEYPPEKVDSAANSTRTGYRNPQSSSLDISRLITLPPPFPRHHPAVNNSHPDLVTHRTTVRSIKDLTEIKATRNQYTADVEKMIQKHQEQVDEGRRQFRTNIQSQIQEGSLTFAEAAEAEAAMIVEENEQERMMIKRQLDTYQEIVLRPMNAILVDRIDRATTCIDELHSMLSEAQRGAPDETQEGGDGKPELLEKLTQFKWLFEAREQLYRESFDLISDRDEKYKAVALLPYQQNKNEDKLRETQAFFAQDALDRRVQFEKEALTRLESFLDTIEHNVVRGVEVQLSAFWDIAPSLLALVQQAPEDLHGFQVQIPADEYKENPSYHAHPLQYFYTLLSHAENSSYQFIESQINLLCLLHGVRSDVMQANRVLEEAERIKRGESEDNVHRDMMATRADEELDLETALKDKVDEVKDQWTRALGSQIEGLRERVKEQLVSEDGWEDLEQLDE